MTEGRILKPKTFRIDDETAEKIRKISESIGGNQQEAFAKLVETYEFQTSKEELPDQRVNIEQFEKYTNALSHMYMVSLEANQTMKETVRTEFNALLQSKETEIQKLREQLNAVQETEKTFQEQMEAAAEQNKELQDLLVSKESEYESKITNLQYALTDKTRLNTALADSCAAEKQKTAAMQERLEILTKENQESLHIKEEMSALHSDYAQLKKQKDALESELQEFLHSRDKAIADLKQHELQALGQCRQQLQLEKDRALLEEERKHQEELNALKQQHQTAISHYQEKYLELLEKMQIKESVRENDKINSGIVSK